MLALIYSLVLSPKRNFPEDEDPQGSTPEEIGVFTIYLLLVSLTVLFLGGIIAYLWMKYILETGHRSTWTLDHLDHVGWILFLASFTIFLSSLTLKKAQKSIEMGYKQKLKKFLILTWTTGLCFILEQIFAWYWIKDFFNLYNKNIYIFIFYLLTFLHTLHLLIGFIFLSHITLKSMKGAYSALSHSPIKYISIYWHFLTGIWFLVFITLYFF
jgi:cytochrome c oxidase subunit III